MNLDQEIEIDQEIESQKFPLHLAFSLNETTWCFILAYIDLSYPFIEDLAIGNSHRLFNEFAICKHLGYSQFYFVNTAMDTLFFVFNFAVYLLKPYMYIVWL